MASHHQHQHQQTHHQQPPLQAPPTQKVPPALDWLSFPAPTVIDAPHPDLFDLELDNSLSAFDQAQVQLLTLDYQSDAFTYFRSDTPQQGPPSVITASSESAYETLSQHSESLYNYSNPSPSQYGVEQSLTADLALDLAAFNVQNTNLTDLSSLAALMSDHRDNGSNYDPYMRSNLSSYSASGRYIPAAAGIAPQHTVPATGRAGSAGDSPKSTDSSHGQADTDPRKKYACHQCTRSFARAYNLKTHLATHDPQRLKPYVCPHRSCGRSFSRKHDLGRHLVSIHRDETGSQYSVASGHSTASGRSEAVRSGIGMSADNAVRSWCDNCGRGFLGPQRACNCNDVK